MKTLYTYLAWVCVFLLVITGASALFLFNIERRAFSAETFKQAFEKQGLYVRMPALLAETLHTSLAQNASTDPFLKTLTVEEWEAGIVFLLPPEDIKLISNGALDSFFAYLNNQSELVSISLVPVKNRLTGPQGIGVVRLIINAQPDCNAEQLFQMGLGFVSGNISLCKPPEEMMGLLTPILESELQAVTNAIPDEITLVSAETNSQVNPRVRLNRIRIMMKLTVLLPLFLLFVLTVLIVHSFTDLLKWWGYPLFITGTVTVFFGFIGSPLLGVVIRGVLQRQGGSLIPPVLIPVLGETVSVVAGQLLMPVIIQGAILGTLGVGLIIGSIVMNIRR